MVPQIPEAIGRAILRSEAALNAVLGGTPTDGSTAGAAFTSADGGNAGADDHAGAGRTDDTSTDDPADHGGAS